MIVVKGYGIRAKNSDYESFEQSEDITLTFDLQASFEIVQDK